VLAIGKSGVHPAQIAVEKNGVKIFRSRGSQARRRRLQELLRNWNGQRLAETEQMVDFAQKACIPAIEFPAIMDKKHAQLTDVDRRKLKIKLGIFFALPTQEEIEAKLASSPSCDRIPSRRNQAISVRLAGHPRWWSVRP
jgi:hypothetical protein